jgi:hypothetical protein
MDIYLDNQPLTCDENTLGGLLSEARQKLGDSERVIVEIRLDGQALDAAALDEQQVIEAEEVQFVTANPRELTVSTLQQVRNALDNARDAQSEAASLLRADQANDALDQIRDLLTVWQQAQQSVLHSAQLLDIPLNEMEANGRPVAEVVDELSEMLSELRTQLTSNDWLGVADTLDEPLRLAVDDWQHLIDALCQRINQP